MSPSATRSAASVTVRIGLVSRFATHTITRLIRISAIRPTTNSVVCRLLTGASTSDCGTDVRKLQPAASIFDHVRTTSLPVNGSLVSIWPLLPAAIESATCLSSALPVFCGELGEADLAGLRLVRAGDQDALGRGGERVPRLVELHLADLAVDQRERVGRAGVADDLAAALDGRLVGHVHRALVGGRLLDARHRGLDEGLGAREAVLAGGDGDACPSRRARRSAGTSRPGACRAGRRRPRRCRTCSAADRRRRRRRCPWPRSAARSCRRWRRRGCCWWTGSARRCWRCSARRRRRQSTLADSTAVRWLSSA